MVRLERIQIVKLFDRFTYDIDLVNGYNVAVLTAPNGCGKTTIFKIIDAIFNPSENRLLDLINVPFEKCICTLSNGKSVGLEISKFDLFDMFEYTQGPKDCIESIHSFLDGTCNRIVYTIYDGDDVVKIDLYERIKQYADPSVSNIDKYFSAKQLFMLQVYRSILEEMIAHDCYISTNFVSANRIHEKYDYGDVVIEDNRYQRKLERIDPLDQMQKHISSMYEQVSDQYNARVAKARDTLPKKYLSNDYVSSMSYTEFAQLWNSYISDMKKYYEIGLLPSFDEVIEEVELEKAFNAKGDFLLAYLNTYKDTLAPLKELYGRTKLMQDILERRNVVTKEKVRLGSTGITVQIGEKIIPLWRLSSGELNDLVMFYNLVFNSSKSGLVLIDEPEISWHIEWQESFLDDLLKICSMNGFQTIVATHSPHIVNGHFELYAERGLQDESEGD